MPRSRKPSNPESDFGPDAGREIDNRFTWVIADQVIAMARPSSDDLAALASRGVTHVISLTIHPVPDEYLVEFSLAGIHIPLPDMSAPTLGEINHFVDALTSLVKSGKKVAVHCGAGLGRTGTMLACYIVSRGLAAEQALREVRRRRPGSVESSSQEDAVMEYEAYLRSSPGAI